MNKNKKNKEYAAFLSFANPDRELVKLLNDLFWYLDIPTYFAPRNLAEAGTPEWRDEIIKNIKKSICYIPIYTRHSLKRSWVNYESGIADSIGLIAFPTKVSGISYKDIEALPPGSKYIYDLFDYEKLKYLICNVGLNWFRNRDKIQSEVNRKFQNSDLPKKIILLSKQRWIFIAGNTPRGSYLREYPVNWYKNINILESRLVKFVKNMTSVLLNEGFCITSCPQVKTVGKIAAFFTTEWVVKNKVSYPNKYRIAGIYPVDREVRESKLFPELQEQWLCELMEFRKSYLNDQECLILIGGSEGTMEEYKAAEELKKIKILPIPCFGGAALKLYEKQSNIPCKECKKKNGICSKENILKIVKYIKG